MKQTGYASIIAGVVSFALVIMLVAFVPAQAQVPKKINWQGVLKDKAGNPVNGQVQMVFGLYDVASGGTALWSEPPRTVTVNAGNYSVDLGAVNPIILTEAKSYWLGIKVEADPEMTPRKELTSAMYSLFVDGITMKNGNVGIGTSLPGTLLHIRAKDGAGASFFPERIDGLFIENDGTLNDYYVFQTVTKGGGRSFSITNAGNVGIGTNKPGTLLHIRAKDGAGASFFPERIDGLFIENDGTLNDYYVFQTVTKGGGRSFSITNAGNVGIGTTIPTHKLSVNGTIRAKEIIVDTGWSDFVFDQNYQLMPLSEVEQRITDEKHLPGIPSAQDVEHNGISLGDMQAKQLQKIEELTLYVIQMNKQLTALQQENEQLKAKLSTLEQAVK